MLLENFNKENHKKLNRINKLLKEQYGISISKKASLEELHRIRTSVIESITALKMNGNVSSTCPALSKQIMMLEGINVLLNSIYNESHNSVLSAKSYDAVLNWLCEYVIKCINLGDDFQDAVTSAMKEYRSSQWRFPDEQIRSDVEHCVLSHFQSNLTEQGLIPMPEQPQVNEIGNILTPEEVENVKVWLIAPDGGLDDGVRGKMSDYYTSNGHSPDDSDENWYFNNVVDDFGDELSCGIDQCDWDDIMCRRQQCGGDGMEVEFGGDEMGSEFGGGDEMPFVDLEKDPEMEPGMGDVVQIQLDPDMLNAIMGQNRTPLVDCSGAKRMKSIKENIVKRLRMLLEAEVSEAEIVIAAKGFSKSLQEMIEKIGRLQNEDLPPLTDQMRDIYGVPQASVFQVEIQQSLQGVMDALYDAKDHVDMAVQKMATGQDLSVDIDMDRPVGGDDFGNELGDELPALPGEEDEFGLEEPGDEFGDEFGGAELEAPLGRVRKESIQSLQKKLTEMQYKVDCAKKLKETKPSAGLSNKKKSEVVKKAKAGKDIGKKGKGFDEVAAAAKKSGAKDPNAVAAAAMWKNVKR